MAISAKRYALYRPDGSLAKRSRSILGMLLSPIEHAPTADTEEIGTDWIDEVWREVISDIVDGRTHEIDWLDVPALRRLAVTNPQVTEQVDALNVKNGRRLSSEAQVKPFNFYLVTTGQ